MGLGHRLEVLRGLRSSLRAAGAGSLKAAGEDIAGIKRQLLKAQPVGDRIPNLMAAASRARAKLDRLRGA